MREENYPRPVSDPEAEGLPGTADDDSTAYDDVTSPREADGDSPAALPADAPLGFDRFGVTPAEARLGESVDYKLGRERPDVADQPEPVPSRGDDVELADAVLDRPDPDAGLAELPPVEPDRSPVSLYDRPDGTDAGAPVGRLVQPDEGGLRDDEKDETAWDAGAAGGGASAEELAMHETREP